LSSHFSSFYFFPAVFITLHTRVKNVVFLLSSLLLTRLHSLPSLSISIDGMMSVKISKRGEEREREREREEEEKKSCTHATYIYSHKRMSFVQLTICLTYIFTLLLEKRTG
jgi:hypothetical protein